MYHGLNIERKVAVPHGFEELIFDFPLCVSLVHVRDLNPVVIDISNESMLNSDSKHMLFWHKYLHNSVNDIFTDTTYSTFNDKYAHIEYVFEKSLTYLNKCISTKSKIPGLYGHWPSYIYFNDLLKRLKSCSSSRPIRWIQ